MKISYLFSSSVKIAVFYLWWFQVCVDLANPTHSEPTVIRFKSDKRAALHIVLALPGYYVKWCYEWMNECFFIFHNWLSVTQSLPIVLVFAARRPSAACHRAAAVRPSRSCIVSIRRKIQLQLLWKSNRKRYAWFLMVPTTILMISIVTSNPDFKITPLFYTEYIRNGTR